MRYASCHPQKKHFAKGLCVNCYHQQHDKERNTTEDRKAERREYQRAATARWRAKHPEKRDERWETSAEAPGRARIPDCHPERRHYARGLCRPCYQRLKGTDAFGVATCHPDRPHVARGLCAACYSAWRYREHAEEESAKQRVYGQAWRNKLREEMLDAFGRLCACPKCPETNPAFLTLDHVAGGGYKHRQEVNSGGGFLNRIRKDGWPKDKYRLLCWNCNAMTRGGKTCPHMEHEEP